MAYKPRKVEEVYEEMVHKIHAGEFGTRGLIPPRTSLMEEFKTTPATVNKAFTLLRGMGLVRSKGRNVIVNNRKFRVPALTPSFDGFLTEHNRVPALTPSFDGFLTEHNLVPFQQNISDPEETTLDADLADKFGLAPGTPVLRRRRLQGEIEDKHLYLPYRIAETYYQTSLLEDAWIERAKTDPFFNITDAYTEKTGKHIEKYHLILDARYPFQEEQDLLKIDIQTFIYEVFRPCYAGDGTMLMASRLLLVSHFFTWEMDGEIFV
jgi:DNA-binding GntR family transcriptional regulator